MKNLFVVSFFCEIRRSVILKMKKHLLDEVINEIAVCSNGLKTIII